LDENLSYRDALKAYREIKDGELWGEGRKVEDRPGLQFRLYSVEHEEKHLRGILEVVEYIEGQAVVTQLGRFNVRTPSMAHYIYIVADRIKAEIV